MNTLLWYVVFAAAVAIAIGTVIHLAVRIRPPLWVVVLFGVATVVLPYIAPIAYWIVYASTPRQQRTLDEGRRSTPEASALRIPDGALTASYQLPDRRTTRRTHGIARADPARSRRDPQVSCRGPASLGSLALSPNGK